MLGKGAALQAFVSFSEPQGVQGLGKPVGSKAGPAVMAYGSAIKMFGLPDDPYEIRKPKTEPTNESFFEQSIEHFSLKKGTITEYEFRKGCGEIPTEKRLTLEEFGEWVAEIGIMADVGNLLD